MTLAERSVDPVRCEGIELLTLALPLTAPFRSVSGLDDTRETLLVRLEAPDGEGWGECVALAEPTYTAEYTAGARHVLERYLIPLLLERRELSAVEVGALFAPIAGHRMAKSALELAVLDAECRAAGVSLAQRLGGQRTEVEVGVVVGFADSVEALVAEVGEWLGEGYRRVKLKIRPGWDLEPLAAVRAAFGPDVTVAADANGTYRTSELDSLIRLDEFALSFVEQPLPAADLVGHARLAARMATPICLDESVSDPDTAAVALELGACSMINIKPGRVGGYLPARRIHDLCADRDVPVWCGGMYESGLGRAANLALAALPNFTRPGDISASTRFFRRDITKPISHRDGMVQVPTGPGLGVDVLPEARDELVVGRSWHSAPHQR